MLSESINLEKVIIENNFNDILLTNVKYMFYNCNSLKYVDLSSFKSSFITEMDRMFENCKLLDISSFNTSKVTTIQNMFLNCVSLKHLKINVDTSLVINMQNMLYNCKSLLSLDLSSFNT